MNEIKQKLQAAAPAIFEGTPVLLAYLYGSFVKALSHPFSDLDIGVCVEDMGIDACLDIANHRIQASEYRIKRRSEGNAPNEPNYLNQL
jgi:predicted nucleotidyltransferase